MTMRAARRGGGVLSLHATFHKSDYRRPRRVRFSYAYSFGLLLCCLIRLICVPTGNRRPTNYLVCAAERNNYTIYTVVITARSSKCEKMRSTSESPSNSSSKFNYSSSLTRSFNRTWFYVNYRIIVKTS